MLLSITEFIGRFHPVLVHLPIGILLLALLFQWLSGREGYAVSNNVLKLVWIIGIASAILSCITGYLLSLNGEYDEGTLTLHLWMGISVAVISLFAGSKVLRLQLDKTYKVCCVLLLFLIIVTGHFGGSLTHGNDYLTAALFNNEKESTAAVIKPLNNVQEAKIYADIVQPLLESKCYSCHGAKKQKGKLRLDGADFILKGGEDKEIIILGNASQSILIKRLLLPEDDKKHMPPRQKSQLKEKEIALLQWWVEQGASFDKKVKETDQPEKMKRVLASLQNGAQKEKHEQTVPQTAVEAADAKAIELLKSKGVIVLPVAQNSNYLMASFISANNFNDKDLQLLLPLKKQLVWLKLSDTKISDDGLAVISRCSNISLLQLDHTLITDKGLSALRSLQALQSLNLVGTNVTAAGIMQLKDLHHLQAVYLFQTKVNHEQSQQLKALFPKVNLETGGYVVPTLETDTTMLKPKVKKKA